MSAASLPAWASIIAAVLLIAGGVCTVLGSLGLLRLPSFEARMHGPSMGNTLGLGCVLLASMLLSSVVTGKAVVHEVLITLLVVTTSPITAMLLMRAAVRRPKDPSGR